MGLVEVPRKGREVWRENGWAETAPGSGVIVHWGPSNVNVAKNGRH